MIVKLPYDCGELPLDLRGFRLQHLRSAAQSPSERPGTLVAAALDHPLAGPSLSDLCQGARTVTVVVPDHTRKADLPLILPEVFARIAGAAPAASIRMLVACGTHPQVGSDRHAELYGHLDHQVAIHHHDSRDPKSLVQVGQLESGLPVRLNRLAVETDVLITVAGVRHHYFAGFGGGPKMVFPGIAGYEEIQANHSRVLIRDEGEGGFIGREASCEPGQLEGNPLAEEIANVADLRPPDLALCLVTTNEGKVGWAAAGPWRKAFLAAVDVTRSWHEIEAGSWPLVIVSGGGAPSDRSLIQCHKALDAACRFTQEGGEVLLIAGLKEGAGAEAMEAFIADPRPEAIMCSLEKRWVQYGHTTLRIVDKTSRFRISVYSELDGEVARRLGFSPVADPTDVLDRWRSEYSGETVGLHSGSAVYPRRN